LLSLLSPGKEIILIDLQTTIKNDPGSIKDPSGCVFSYGDKVCRVIHGVESNFYSELVGSDFFKNLVHSGYFIPTQPVNLNRDPAIIKKFGDKAVFFEHELINRLSYSYEWSVSMLIDAAEHTLKLQELLLEKNLSLKDATPYNIQFRGSQPVFIDLGSIEKVSRNGIWIAYNQFCQMFLYPILMFQFGVSNLNTINLTHLDGLTLEETVSALGLRPYRKYGLIIDYLIPSIFIKLKRFKNTDITQKTISTSRVLKNSAQIQSHSVQRLLKVLKKLRNKKTVSNWTNYVKSFSYNDDEYKTKKQFINNFFDKYSAMSVLDIGSNIGEFSIMAAEKGCDVVALEYDHDCVEHLYEFAKEKKYSILPLHVNIANPSPSIGWFNDERPSLLNRIKDKYDCVLTLALTHHLLVTHRVPIAEIFRLFSHCTSRYLITEYVGTPDKMFKTLMKYRAEKYDDFNIKQFEETSKKYFTIIEKIQLSNPSSQMDRCLYIMELCS
jgi:hypothetical protein